MTLVMVVLRFLLDTVSFPELLSEWFVSITPPRVFAVVLGVLQAYAKPLLFVSLLIAQVILGGALGVLYTLLLEPVPYYKEPRWPRGILFGLVLWLLTVMVAVPIAGGGFLGSSMATGQADFLAAIFVPYMVYGWFLTSAYQDLTQRVTLETSSSGRRYFLKWATMGMLALALGGYAARLFAERGPSTTVGGIASGEMPTPLTSNKQFYVVSKNVIDPQLSPVGWELRVEGLVEEPYTLTYDELTALPWVEETITLECISNPVGGDLIGNAVWRGVPLKDILERAGLRPEVVDIASFAEDGYSESLTKEKALEPQVLLAYLMNGEPLSFKHGFPARLMIPGLYGEKCIKWLNKLEAVDRDYLGFWPQQGWSDTAEIKTTSQIRVPEGGRLRTGEILVGGIAFSGDKGISKVEFSPDNGETWLPATLQDPLSPYTWVLWTSTWLPSETGRTWMQVRATDGQGRKQVVDAPFSTFPDGATGLHSVRLTIEAGESS
jgi:DMSO/TMAO reductase YedYZ molybdopterin-dependent catalytic subunit